MIISCSAHIYYFVSIATNKVSGWSLHGRLRWYSPGARASSISSYRICRRRRRLVVCLMWIVSVGYCHSRLFTSGGEGVSDAEPSRNAVLLGRIPARHVGGYAVIRCNMIYWVQLSSRFEFVLASHSPKRNSHSNFQFLWFSSRTEFDSRYVW